MFSRNEVQTLCSHLVSLQINNQNKMAEGEKWEHKPIISQVIIKMIVYHFWNNTYLFLLMFLSRKLPFLADKKQQVSWSNLSTEKFYHEVQVSEVLFLCTKNILVENSCNKLGTGLLQHLFKQAAWIWFFRLILHGSAFSMKCLN